MKKILIGCGVIVLLGVIGICVAVYGVYKIGKGVMEGMTEIRQKYAAVDAKYPFKMPADGLMTAEQMDKWLGVRMELVAPANELKVIFTGNPNRFGSVKKMFTLMKQLATDHAAALDKHQMSSGEYSWITGQVVGVLTSGDAKMNPKLKALIDEIEKFQAPNQQNRQSGSLGMIAERLTTEHLAKLMPIVESRVDLLDRTKDVFMFDMFIGDSIEKRQYRQQRGYNAGDGAAYEEDEGTTGTEERTMTPAMSPAPVR